MARYAATGAQVTLVTCTLGEEGEIHVPELAQLEAAQADQLGGAPSGVVFGAGAPPRVDGPRFPCGGGRCPRPGSGVDPPDHHRPPAAWPRRAAAACVLAGV